MTTPEQRAALRAIGIDPDASDETPARNRNRRRREPTEGKTLTSADELDVEGIYARFNAKNDAE